MADGSTACVVWTANMTMWTRNQESPNVDTERRCLCDEWLLRQIKIVFENAGEDEKTFER